MPCSHKKYLTSWSYLPYKSVLIQSRLYKESSHLHATHDADVLKKVEGGVENDTQENAIPERVMTLLQSGAFQSLCQHLRVRSDEVQNMELMTISGFCRNCLAKVCFFFSRILTSILSRMLDSMI